MGLPVHLKAGPGLKLCLTRGRMPMHWSAGCGLPALQQAGHGLSVYLISGHRLPVFFKGG